MSQEELTIYSFSELEKSGLLWMINRYIFHPRGFTFGLVPNDKGEITGWAILGHGKECYKFTPEMDDMGFLTAETFLAKKRGWYI